MLTGLISCLTILMTLGLIGSLGVQIYLLNKFFSIYESTQEKKLREMIKLTSAIFNISSGCFIALAICQSVVK